MNKTWWQERYIDRKAWILENVRALNLEPGETLVLLLIETANSHHDEISLHQLAQRSNLEVQAVDRLLSQLVRKGHLTLQVEDNHVHYDLSGLYSSPLNDIQPETSDLVEIYEREFKRPLSTREISKLNDWLAKVDYDFLIHALREAIIYHKLNFDYIDRILVKWVNDKVTLEALNAGERHAPR